MNFFDAQDAARRRSTLLVTLFLLAVATLVGLANLLVLLFATWRRSGAIPGPSDMLTGFDGGLAFEVTTAVLVLVAAGSFYKMWVLSGGGRVVAEALGGRRVSRVGASTAELRLLNVVEEAALAAGTPVPQVFLLPEPGINAFAAGLTPGDAVIAVTRGSLEHLDRDELQGVVAHEFAHIVGGDMQLNIRLVGLLHGILLLGLLGQNITRATLGGPGRRYATLLRGGLPLAALGIALTVVGYGGTLFGGLIKAAVNRQREYLADASAVQFTRNPRGISGALRKIGALEAGSRLLHPTAGEFSHALFATGIGRLWGGLLESHPPLAMRIRRMDPRWNGKFAEPAGSASAPGSGPAAGTAAPPAPTREAVAAAALHGMMVDQMIARAGRPEAMHLSRARGMLARVPEAVRDALSDPYGARAVVYCLLLSAGATAAEAQLNHLQEHADTGVARLTRGLAPAIRELGPSMRLPLVDLALPTLHRLSVAQYQKFRGNLRALIAVDKRISLFEWVLLKTVLHHLEPTFGAEASASRPLPPLGTVSIRQVAGPCAAVLSVLAHAGPPRQRDARLHFDAACRYLGTTELELLPREGLSFAGLEQALSTLARLRPLFKRRLLRAFAEAIRADGSVSIAEVEVLRVIADALECPLPPPVEEAQAT
ncbi:MAG: M48 family metalloprotease [Nitrospirota bacterium]|nr:M48 family metalloprotease [Nitrospirota bacterium]